MRPSSTPFRCALIEDLLHSYEHPPPDLTGHIIELERTYENVYGLTVKEIAQCEDVAAAIVGTPPAHRILELRAVRLGLELPNPHKSAWRGYLGFVA